MGVFRCGKKEYFSFFHLGEIMINNIYYLMNAVINHSAAIFRVKNLFLINFN